MQQPDSSPPGTGTSAADPPPQPPPTVGADPDAAAVPAGTRASQPSPAAPVGPPAAASPSAAGSSAPAPPPAEWGPPTTPSGTVVGSPTGWSPPDHGRADPTAVTAGAARPAEPSPYPMAETPAREGSGPMAPTPTPVDKSHGLRGGLVAAAVTAVVVAVFGNQWVVHQLQRQVRHRWLQPFIANNQFAHWSVSPPPDNVRTNAVFERAFWPDSNGGPALSRLDLSGERTLHWVGNFGRIGLLVVGIGVAVAFALAGHRGHLIARLVAAWGAVVMSAAIVGGISTTIFYVLSDEQAFSTPAGFFSGAAFGAQWAILLGIPAAMLAALASRPSSSRR